MYTIKNLSISYKINDDNDYVVINNVNLNFPKKGLVFIIGKSGCGKTSLLNALENNIKPTSGTILYKNQNLNEFNKKEINNFRKNEIGVLFQSYNLISNITVKENLIIAADIKNIKYKKIDKLLENFQLFHLKDRCIDSLSGGEKQRIAFIRSIINEPNVLLCDEPTGAIDDENTEILMNFLIEYSTKHLVIIVTHNKGLIKNHMFVEIKNGKVFPSFDIENDALNTFNDDKHKNKESLHYLNILKNRLFRKYKLKNILFCFSLIFSIFSSLLSFSFKFGIDNQHENIEYKFIKSNIFEVANKITTSSENSPLEIVKKERPTFNNVNNLFSGIFKDYLVTYSYDFFISGEREILINESEIFDYKLDFFYLENYTSPIIINDLFFDKYISNNKKDTEIVIKLKKEYSYSKLINETFVEVVEDFEFEEKFNTFIFKREFKYLNTPTIFINLLFFENYIKNQSCEKINRKFISNLSWFDLIKIAKNNEDLAGYYLNLILFNKNDIEKMHGLIKNFQRESNISIENKTYTISTSFLEITNILMFGLIAFSVISIISMVALLFFVVTSFSLSERKTVAILKILGAKEQNIKKVFINNSLSILFYSLASGILILYLISFPLNSYLNKKFYLDGLLQINIKKINIQCLFIQILIIFIMFILVYFITCISQKRLFEHEIDKELREE